LSQAGAAVATVSRTGSDIGLSLIADVSRAEDVEQVGTAVEEALGRPTILVNAAGVYGPIHLVADSDPSAWIETLMVNTVAAYLTCRVFVPGMLEGGWGRIINVTSAASLHPPGALNSAYGTSKAALNQFTRHLAAEVAGTGVTANVLHPGDVKTAIWSDMVAQLGGLGREADVYRDWVVWVNETGGDPPEKAGDAVLEIISGADNGEFRWIREPLQRPIPSWPTTTDALPWEGRAGDAGAGETAGL
jgi:NAD(P)-dependent dehydrogenase (short-subunit alcohol dehydrogenase family)